MFGIQSVSIGMKLNGMKLYGLLNVYHDMISWFGLS